MIILFANQKGGVGKSTLVVLFSNYLSLAKNKAVTVYDMDFQRSLYNKAQAAQILENKPLYEVRASELNHFESIRSEEHTSELQSRENLVCRLLLEKKNRPRLRLYK